MRNNKEKKLQFYSVQHTLIAGASPPSSSSSILIIKLWTKKKIILHLEYVLWHLFYWFAFFHIFKKYSLHFNWDPIFAFISKTWKNF